MAGNGFRTLFDQLQWPNQERQLAPKRCDLQDTSITMPAIGSRAVTILNHYHYTGRTPKYMEPLRFCKTNLNEI